MCYLNNQTQEKLPDIQMYIYAPGCLKEKTENVYIRPWLSNGKNPQYDGISKRSP